MGGQNESVLSADKPASAASPGSGPPQGTILQPDAPPPSVGFSAPANTVAAVAPQQQMAFAPPMQIQAIRQHMNAGQIHLHCDAQNLKVAVPVAEWYVIMRHLKSLNPFTWVDTENKCVATMRPYIHAGLFEVAIELSPINIGARFQDMTLVTGKR